MYTHPTITSREHQILELISLEHSSKEIANKLYISNYTVHTHRQNLLRKLRAKNTAGLVRRGFEMGVLKVVDYE